MSFRGDHTTIFLQNNCGNCSTDRLKMTTIMHFSGVVIWFQNWQRQRKLITLFVCSGYVCLPNWNSPIFPSLDDICCSGFETGQVLDFFCFWSTYIQHIIHAMLWLVSFQKNHGSSCFIKMWKQEMTLFLRSSLLPLYCISRNKWRPYIHRKRN